MSCLERRAARGRGWVLPRPPNESRGQRLRGACCVSAVVVVVVVVGGVVVASASADEGWHWDSRILEPLSSLLALSYGLPLWPHQGKPYVNLLESYSSNARITAVIASFGWLSIDVLHSSSFPWSLLYEVVLSSYLVIYAAQSLPEADFLKSKRAESFLEGETTE
jgi:hypothetical protein